MLHILVGHCLRREADRQQGDGLLEEVGALPGEVPVGDVEQAGRRAVGVVQLGAHAGAELVHVVVRAVDHERRVRRQAERGPCAGKEQRVGGDGGVVGDVGGARRDGHRVPEQPVADPAHVDDRHVGGLALDGVREGDLDGGSIGDRGGRQRVVVHLDHQHRPGLHPQTGALRVGEAGGAGDPRAQGREAAEAPACGLHQLGQLLVGQGAVFVRRERERPDLPVPVAGGTAGVDDGLRLGVVGRRVDQRFVVATTSRTTPGSRRRPRW